MTKQVLISYASADQTVAFRVCEYLEAVGVPCWIAPRDILPGSDWSNAIVRALDEVSIVVLIFSSSASASKHVPREIERSDSKSKILIPFIIEEATPSGPLEYYMGATQGIMAYPDAVESYFPTLQKSVRAHLDSPDQTAISSSAEPKKAQVGDADLVALARAICRNIHEELRSSTRTFEVGITISEPKHGQAVKVIDAICNKLARETIMQWSKRHQCEVLLVGEDLAPFKPSAARPPVICCLDSLDGTQHWLRSRNLYCTALSLFQRGPNKTDPYRLRVSAVQNAGERIFITREDLQASFVDDDPTPVLVPKTEIAKLAEAQVCTVARRPGHFQILMKHLSKGSPFQGLYTFGGNPILCEMVLGRYDAVFQPEASSIGDSQDIWDWLPGGHTVFRAGGCILDHQGKPLNVVQAAEECLAGKQANFPYVAAANSKLAAAIVAWLADRNG